MISKILLWWDNFYDSIVMDCIVLEAAFSFCIWVGDRFATKVTIPFVMKVYPCVMVFPFSLYS